MNIGENIKAFRIAYGLDQKELASKLNISYKTVSSWECGRTEPKMGMVEKIADVFGVAKSDIIEGKIYETFSSPEEFELAWHKAGGGRHPIELSDDEYRLVLEYRLTPELKDFIARLNNLPQEYQKAVYEALEYQEYRYLESLKKKDSNLA